MDSTDYPSGFFNRMDDSPDPMFYVEPRKVVHIDDGAIAAVTQLYSELVPPGAQVLDLMSSWRSHLPNGVAGRVTGLGMSREEMDDNPQLDEAFVHDLNVEPRLPFADESFDAVVCCVSVQYMTRPLETFADVARCLRRGSPFVVTFSNRCFPSKAIAGWLFTDDAAHVGLVRGYFQQTPAFGPPHNENRSPGWGDPLYALWAEKLPRPGGGPGGS
jgi:SAM-dependent methyltransferase